MQVHICSYSYTRISEYIGVVARKIALHGC